MTRIIDSHDVEQYVRYFEYAGLSTDQKPTSGGFVINIVNGERVTYNIAIATGSVFLEVDTGDAYLFDEVSSTWNKVGD